MLSFNMKTKLKNYIPINIDDPLLEQLETEKKARGFEKMGHLIRYILREYFKNKGKDRET